MSRRRPSPARVLDRVPLVVQVVIATMAVAVLVWSVIAERQRAELRALFGKELQAELERQAQEDRQLLDRRVQSLHHAATLITSQQRFRDYLGGAHWRDGPEEGIVHHNALPPWLPAASVMRAFFTARHALLIAPDGTVREVYHHLPASSEKGLAPGLREPGALLRKLSHNQSYMTDIEGQPSVVATEALLDGQGREMGTLMLQAPLDSDFLAQAAGLFRSGNVMALLGPAGERVIASSQPGQIPAGTAVAALRGSYRMIGKSFFDYGASDLDVQFASFIPTERAERLTETVLARNNHQRTVLVVALVAAFAALVGWIAWRIAVFNKRVGRLARDRLGLPAYVVGKGDELKVLERRFNHLLDGVVGARNALRREAEERVAAERRGMKAEQRQRELQLLKSMTGTLGVGILMEGGDGPRPFNELMERLVAETGGDPSIFLPERDQQEVERTLEDTSGATRVFLVGRHDALGERACLVREVTAERLAEQELRLWSNLRAANPNPVLRVDFGGRVLYANPAARTLLRELGGSAEEVLPGQWWEVLRAGLAERGESELEVVAGERTYALIPGFIEGANFVYLYGVDISDRKRAEREHRLAAAITRNVLDGIIVTDTDGIIQAVNPGFTRITGFTAEEVVGRKPNVIKSDRHDRAFYEGLWETLMDEGQWEGEIWNRRRDGEVFPTLSRISAIADDEAGIVNFVSVFTDISERKAEEERLSHMAYHDALTGLSNRVLLLDRLAHAIQVAGRKGRRFGVLYLDLDGFKAINDEYGHNIGDIVLQRVADRLRALVRDSDTISRLGGDEFAVLVDEVPDRAAVEAVARKVREGMEEPIRVGGQGFPVGASVGIATYPEDGSRAEELLENADADMYARKQARKAGRMQA